MEKITKRPEFWLNSVIAKSNFTGTNKECLYKVGEDLIPAPLNVPSE